MLAARAVDVEINFTVPGLGRTALDARAALTRELEGCDFTVALQKFIDSHRDQINYVIVNGRQMDVAHALYLLNDYIESQMEPGTYRLYPMPTTTVPTPTETTQEEAPQVVRTGRIEAAPLPEMRSPLEAMQAQEERARTQVQQPEQAEQVEPPPQLQEQEGTLLTQQEAAVVEAVPEAVREQAAEQVRENVQAINAAVPVMPRELGVAQLGVVRSAYYANVMDMWDELKRLCDQSTIIADKLKYVTDQYYSTLERLEEARGTPGANALQNKVRELERQMRELSRQLDPLLAKQGQLLTDILAYMPDAFAEAMREPRDRDEMLAELGAIRDEWKSQQEKILAALSLRELGGEIAEALRPALAATRRGSIENMYDVFARMMQTNPVVETQFVDWVALGEAVRASYGTIALGPIGVAAPVAGEAAATGGAFEFRSRRGTFRIEIAGEDLSGMTFAEVKKLVTELVNDQSISNQQLLGMLTVEQLREGREPYRYRSRYLLRTQFFQDYASGNIRVLETAPLTAVPTVPAAAYEAARALPTMPPVVAGRPAPAAAQPALAITAGRQMADALENGIPVAFSPVYGGETFGVRIDPSKLSENQIERIATIMRGAGLADVNMFTTLAGIARAAPGAIAFSDASGNTLSATQVMSRLAGAPAPGAMAGRAAPPVVAERPLPVVPTITGQPAEVAPIAPAVETRPTAPAAPAAPTVVPTAPVASPVTAPSTTAPTTAAPEAALTQERAAEAVFNYARLMLSEPEARRISDYVAGRRVFGRMAFSSEETATRVFDALNPYIQLFHLNPLVLREEDGRLVLRDVPRPAYTDAILENLARTNTNFTEEVANWAADAYNEANPGFPVTVEGWYTPAEIFHRGRMIEMISSALFRTLRSMDNAAYRVDRGEGMETVDAYDFGAYYAFGQLGRGKVELSEAEAGIGRFETQDIQVLFAWAMSCYTGNHENIYDNMLHALDPSHQTADQTYSGMRLSRASLDYYNNNFQGYMDALPQELQAAIDYNAIILGAMIKAYYVRAYGEPANEEAAAQLDTACINAGRVILLGQMEAEMSRGWHETFTYDGQEYMLGTHLLTRPTGQGIMIDGAQREQLLVLPTSDPLEVMVVGYWERGRAHMLREGGGTAVANVRLEATLEGMAFIPHHVSGRDSLGDGTTVMWSYPSPGYGFGEMARGMPDQYRDVVAPPFTGLPAGYEDAMPPALRGRQYRIVDALPNLAGEAEYYTVGERLDEAVFTVSGPVELRARDGTAAGTVSLTEMLENPYTYAEWAMLRHPRAGENAYYSVRTDQVSSAYGDLFQGDLVHTAEFRDGKVYIYMDMSSGKIVDAYDPSLRDAEGHEVRRIAVGSYSFTFAEGGEKLDSYIIEIKPGSEAASAGAPQADVLRRIILARMDGTVLAEQLHEAASGEQEVSISFDVYSGATVRVPHEGLYPPNESYLAMASVIAPMFYPVAGEAGALGTLGRFSGRLAEIHTEYLQVAQSLQTITTAEQEMAAEKRLAELLLERRGIYAQMIADVDAMIPTASGEQLAQLESFRQKAAAEMGKVSEEALNAIITGSDLAEGEHYYSFVYMTSLWRELEQVHAQFDGLSQQYYATEDAEEKAKISDQGWELILRRREIYEQMLTHLSGAVVYDPDSYNRLAEYSRELSTNMEAYLPDSEVHYDSLRQELGR
jgi:hypothetical protein